MKALKEREFYKALLVWDLIADCMDKETGLIKDFKNLQNKIKDILEN
jgi:hypothetical protein